jgi:protein-disulfide isomerase
MSAPANHNDDPTLAMCKLWQRDRDHFDELLRLTSQRERIVFNATPEQHEEAQRLFQAAAKVSDEHGDKLERFTRAIFRSKAQSLEGAVAKLAIAIRHTAPSPQTNQEPWPYLRNVQADLERLQAEAANANRSSD